MGDDDLPEDKGENVQQLVTETEIELAPVYAELDLIALENQRRVLRAFQRNRVSEYHFRPSTGYGYG
ncbi:MAG: methionine gamma-lyase family protein, partial [Eubacteriales bacterium]|nr:methionine gamma-lyase family protein [Eubacteriales bacterium]